MLILTLNLFVSATLAEDAHEVVWSSQLGTNFYDRSNSVALDATGSILISGSTKGHLGGENAGKEDAFLVKYDLSGNILWIKQLGTSESDMSQSVAVDLAGNAYITGSTSGSLDGDNVGASDAFLAKYDTSGNFLWIKQLGTSESDSSRSVAVDQAGNAYITGSTSGSLDGDNAGQTDAFLAKYNAAGNLLWTRQLGTSNAEVNTAVAIDQAGSVYITGSTFGSLSGDNAGQSDVFLAKYDFAGNLIWTQQFGTSDNDSSTFAALDGSGNIFISGKTYGSLNGANEGNADAFLVKYDPAGNRLWTRQYGTSNNDLFASVALDGSDYAYVSGFIDGAVQGNADAFLARYDSAGNLLWTKELALGEVGENTTLAVDTIGNAYISGGSKGELGEDNWDILLTRFSPAKQYDYSGGSGTITDPYQIATKQDLADLGKNTVSFNKYFILTADIDLAGETYTTAVIAPDTPDVSDDFNNIPFKGIFDGKGHVIRNLTIDTAGVNNDYLGLFGEIYGSNAEVKNLGMENMTLIGGDTSNYLGGLCGKNSGNINNCYVIGTINGGTCLGGLCGSNNGIIDNCYTMSDLSGNTSLGGMCGQNMLNGIITNGYSTGPVSGLDLLGGFCGENDGAIDFSFWDVDTSGMGSEDDDNNGATGKTTLQLWSKNLFTDTGWDFIGETENGSENIWRIDDGFDYPRIDWQAEIPIEKYQLTITPLGNGSVSPESRLYRGGYQVSLVAEPDEGFRVKSWTGTDDDSSVVVSNTVTIDSDKEVIVEFEPNINYLTTLAPDGHGILPALSGGYNADSVVEITATPDEGYHVKGWYDQNNTLLSTEETITVIMDSDKTISVLFDQTADLVILNKCLIKAGKTRDSLDSFRITGTLDMDSLSVIVDESNEATDISVNLTTDGSEPTVGHQEVLDPALVKINSKRTNITYKARALKGEPGRITVMSLNLKNGKFTIAGNNLDLTGLKDLVTLEIHIGSYFGKGMAYDSGESDVVNGSKSVPIQFMSGYEDALTADKVNFRLGKKQDTDVFTIQGSIAVLDNMVDIASEDVVITFGSYSVTLPADDLFKIGNKTAFKYKKPRGSDSSVAVAMFSLEKCTYKVVIKKAAIGDQGSEVNFSVNFGTFNETVSVPLTEKRPGFYLYP
ncbi:MAG: SBBP repeat-containing protein [Phycisphaerae bacterium]|nr:SBBP repeat-containing protein [Phycisphaerae bacterium]